MIGRERWIGREGWIGREREVGREREGERQEVRVRHSPSRRLSTLNDPPGVMSFSALLSELDKELKRFLEFYNKTHITGDDQCKGGKLLIDQIFYA